MKISIVTTHNLSNAYSCLFYFAKHLSEETKEDVQVYSPTKQKKIDKKFLKFHKSFYIPVFHWTKYIGYIVSVIVGSFVLLFSDVMVVNDLEFFMTAWVLKKLFKKRTFILYNTELYCEGIPCPKLFYNFYKKNAASPDVIIECSNERAEYRKEKFHIDKKIYVINNTIEKNDAIPEFSKSDLLDFKNDNPILIYAGGVDKTRGIGAMLNVIGDFLDKANFVFFCYGKEKQIDDLRNMYSKYDNCRIYSSISKEELYEVMKWCDIGIQYYNPEINLNNKLAAPSKFYEYISLGLNVLSTKNNGIDKIIEKYKVGKCFNNDGEISIVLNEMLEEGLANKERIKTIFNTQLCYEMDSKETIDFVSKQIKK